MNTTLYKLLNDDAKSWWYHHRLREQGQVEEARKLEQESILNDLRHLRLAIQNNGFLTVGRGGWTLHYGKHNRLQGHGCGLDDAIPQACLLLGIPVLDTTTIHDARLDETLSIPIANTDPDPEPEGGYGPWDYAPFEVVARLYATLGATIYNIDEED